VQCATFSRSLNPRNIDKSVSDIRIQFPFENSFWISVFGCKFTILPDIQPANRLVIISARWQWKTTRSLGESKITRSSEKSLGVAPVYGLVARPTWSQVDQGKTSPTLSSRLFQWMRGSW